MPTQRVIRRSPKDYSRPNTCIHIFKLTDVWETLARFQTVVPSQTQLWDIAVQEVAAQCILTHPFGIAQTRIKMSE